jgi:hypothetical protein
MPFGILKDAALADVLLLLSGTPEFRRISICRWAVWEDRRRISADGFALQCNA